MFGPSAGSGFEIVAREDFSDLTFLLEIRHPMMAKAARPGQFVIVMSHEHGERIPLTLADYDRDKGTITLVIQAVGKTTREMQRDCVVGASLYGVTGHDSGMLRRMIDIPVAGMFSAGEIAPIQGATFVHGYTSVFGLIRPRTAAAT